jgi:outer membrane protein TolC
LFLKKFINNKVVLLVILIITVTGCSVKPKLITKKELNTDIKENLEFITKNSTPITKEISLEEAINRAIKYNLDKKVSVMERALAQKEAKNMTYELLPKLTASAGYSARNNYAASASTSFTNNQPDPLDANPTYSLSSSKSRFTSDMEFSWNILDFGLSYIRAKQQSDKYLISIEREKKVKHNITKDVRKAYYEALSATELIEKIEPIMIETKKAIEFSQKAKSLRVSSSMEALTYQRELHDILRSLNSIRKELITSKTILSELMGLKPGTQFKLVKLKKDEYLVPSIPLTINEMEKIAIKNRPEIHESRYKERISEEEITAAKLSILPRFGISTGLHYDNSEYLLNGDWFSYGATVSWNLFDLFGYSNRQDIAKSKFAIAKQQKLAIYMAVLSQVHLSYIKFKELKKDYILSKRYLEISDEIFSIIKSKNELNLNSDLIFIKEKLNHILAILRHSSSYAQMQNSYGELLVSIGDLDAFKNSSNNIVKKPKIDIIKIEENNNSNIDNSLKFANINNQENIKKNTTKIIKDALLSIQPTILHKETNSIKKDNIEIKHKVVATTKTRAKVRLKPSTKSEYIDILEKDENINIIGKVYSADNGFWYQVENGFIHSNIVHNHRVQ